MPQARVMMTTNFFIISWLETKSQRVTSKSGNSRARAPLRHQDKGPAIWFKMAQICMWPTVTMASTRSLSRSRTDILILHLPSASSPRRDSVSPGRLTTGMTYYISSLWLEGGTLQKVIVTSLAELTSNTKAVKSEWQWWVIWARRRCVIAPCSPSLSKTCQSTRSSSAEQLGSDS